MAAIAPTLNYRHHPAMTTAKNFRESLAQPKEEPPIEEAVKTPETPVQVPTEQLLTPTVEQPQEGPSIRELELMRQIAELEASNQELSAAQQKRLDDEKQRLDELQQLRDFKREIELEQLTNVSKMDFETVDSATAQEISSKVLKPTIQKFSEKYEAQLASTLKQLEEERNQRQKLQQDLTQAEQQKRLAKTNERIFKKHPDFKNLLDQNNDFAKFRQSKVEGSSITYDELMRHEYNKGNSDFIISLVDQFKKNKPTLESVANVGTNTVATTPTNTTPTAKYTQSDKEKWLHQTVTGQLSRAKYRELMEDYRKQSVST